MHLAIPGQLARFWPQTKAHYRDGVVRSRVTEAHGQLRNECLICRSIDTVPSVYLPLQKY